MANRLFRLGGWAFEHRKRVVALWALVLVGVIARGRRVRRQDQRQVLGARHRVAGSAGPARARSIPAACGTYARLVFAAPKGEKLTDAENKAGGRGEPREGASRPKDVSGVTNPYQTKASTEDGRIGYADVIYPVTADKIDDVAREELEATGTPAEEAGMQVEFGGGLVADESEVNSESLGHDDRLPRARRSRSARCWRPACRC